jgi:SynChlorMet cassette protein ScmC
MPVGKQKFFLPLAGGGGWLFQAEPSLEPWLAAFAAIMSLPRRTRSVPENTLRFLSLTDGKINDPGFAEEIRNADQQWQIFYADSDFTKLWLSEKCREQVLLGLDAGLCGHQSVRILNMETALLPVHLRNLENGGVWFHAALAQRGRQGILIAAPGETGKSTCSRRLPAPWVSLADDMCLLSKQPGTDNFSCQPLPTWNDYLLRNSRQTWDCRQSVPLRALFFLEQADTDAVVPLNRAQAAVRMMAATGQAWDFYWRKIGRTRARSLKMQSFNNISLLARQIPAYVLKATRDGRFWEEIERVLL